MLRSNISAEQNSHRCGPFNYPEGQKGIEPKYVPAILLGGAFLGFLITTIPPYIIALICLIAPLLLIAVDYFRNFRK